ncbi:MAG TPA: hypothetical protein VG965_07040 [Patescibacteria group bacterium]|nr:hypothetical protein [Patescibacteria group bacterium]
MTNQPPLNSPGELRTLMTNAVHADNRQEAFFATEIGLAMGWSVLRGDNANARERDAEEVRHELKAFNHSPFTHNVWRLANEIEPPEHLNRGFIGEVLRKHNSGAVLDAFNSVTEDRQIASLLNGLSHANRLAKIDELSAEQKKQLNTVEGRMRAFAETRGIAPDEVDPRYLAENASGYGKER